MINFERSNDIRNGIVLKGNGTNKVGIFYGDLTPDLEDPGGIMTGSLFIRTNGEIWQKTGTLNTSWVLNSSTSTGSGGSSQSIQAVFGRRGTVSANTWLKLNGKVSSDKSGLVVGIPMTKIMLTFSCEQPTTSTIRVYVKDVNGVFVSGYGALVVTNARTAQSSLINMSTAISSGSEVAVKLDSGTAEDVVVNVMLVS